MLYLDLESPQWLVERKLRAILPDHLEELPSNLYCMRDESERLYNASSDFLKPVLVVAVNTGMRRSGVLYVKWDNVILKPGYISVIESKNNESLSILINKTLMDTLDYVNNTSPGDYVFSHSNGEHQGVSKTLTHISVNA